LLDEVGNAEVCDLFIVKNFMVHFHLKDKPDNLEGSVPVELEGWGEDTEDMLFERVYPIYSKAIDNVMDSCTEEDVPQDKIDAASKQLSEALITEKKRQWGAKKPARSSDPEAAHLQAIGHDIPKTIAERIVKEHRRKQFEEMPAKSKKVQ
jgi:hypothetical protein